MQRSKDIPQGQPVPHQQLQRSNTLPYGHQQPRPPPGQMSLAPAAPSYQNQNHFSHAPSMQQRGYSTDDPRLGMMFDRQGQLGEGQFGDPPANVPVSRPDNPVGQLRPPPQPGSTAVYHAPRQPPPQPGSTVMVGRDYFDAPNRTGMGSETRPNGPGMDPVNSARGRGMGPSDNGIGVPGTGMGQDIPDIGGNVLRPVGQHSPRASSKRRPPMSMQASDVSELVVNILMVIRL